MKLDFKHSSNLDVIRTIAVFMVVARHVLGILHVEKFWIFDVQFLGIFGVLLFFILTAHVLMFSLERMKEERSNAWVLYGDFIVRRIFRIFPLSMCVVAAAFFASRFGDFPGVNTLDLGPAVANFFLVQNLTLSPDIIGTLWSLPIEVQMYLFLPIIFLVIKDRSVVCLLVVYLIAVGCAVIFYKFQFGQVARYAPCFVPGIIAFFLVSRRVEKKLPFPALLLGILFAWISYQILGRWSQTVGGYPACLALSLLFPFVAEGKSKLVESVCAWVAKYSYGIYLIHVPVLSVCFLLPLPIYLRLAVFLVVTGFLSFVVYRYIEHPMIQLGNKFTRRRARDVVVRSASDSVVP